MIRHEAITVAQAAQCLGIGSRRLFQLMRARGVIVRTSEGNNIVTRFWVERGFFRNEHCSYFLRGTRVQRWYTKPLVTGLGLALLQEFIESGMETNGRPLVAEQQRPPHQRRPPQQPDQVRSVEPAIGHREFMEMARRQLDT